MIGILRGTVELMGSWTELGWDPGWSFGCSFGCRTKGSSGWDKRGRRSSPSPGHSPKGISQGETCHTVSHSDPDRSYHSAPYLQAKNDTGSTRSDERK